MNTDVSENIQPIEEETETPETPTEETKFNTDIDNLPTEDVPDSEGPVLDDTENNTENPENLQDVETSDETNEETSLTASEMVSGSDVRIDEMNSGYPEISGNDVYVIEATTEEPPFLTKPFSDYTTSEGLLLLILILLIFSILWNLINGK